MIWLTFVKSLLKPKFVIPAILVFGSVWTTQHVVSSDYQARIAEIEKTHSDAILRETVRVLSLERQLSAMNSEVEESYAQQQKLRQETAARIDGLVSDGFRLRDKNRKLQASCSSTSTATNTDHGAEGSELSEELTRFLVSEATRADGIVDQLSACQEYVSSLHQKLKTSNR